MNKPDSDVSIGDIPENRRYRGGEEISAFQSAETYRARLESCDCKGQCEQCQLDYEAFRFVMQRG